MKVRESSVADLSSTDYLQTYIVLKPKDPQRPDAMRDVMFRFGSWCYSGRVQVLHITQHTHNARIIET